MTRRSLQFLLVLLGLVPTITGILGLLGVDDPLYAALSLPRDPLLDSNMRFYAGMWFVLGVAVLSTVRALEKHFALYRILWAMIFVGGIGRLLSMFFVGLPPAPFIGFTALEIVGAPLFLYWHAQVVKEK